MGNTVVTPQQGWNTVNNKHEYANTWSSQKNKSVNVSNVQQQQRQSQFHTITISNNNNNTSDLWVTAQHVVWHCRSTPLSEQCGQNGRRFMLAGWIAAATACAAGQ
jgi:hypothetical protein